MNRIFLCDSPYQLFSAMCIIDNEQTIDNDMILLLGIFHGWEEYENKLTCEKYKHIVVKKSENKIKTIVSFLVECIKLRKSVEKLTKLYVTSQNGYAVLFCNVLNCYHNEICFFDEGLYTYICSLGEDPFHEYYSNHKLFRIMFSKSELNYKGVIYAFEPKLLVDTTPNKKRIWHNQRISSGMLLQSPNMRLIDYDIIIFDQYFLTGKLASKYEEILELLQKNVERKVCLKKHPRNGFFKADSSSFDVVENDKNLWEIECIKMNLSGKILITPYSSAVFSPAILGVGNYTIILLYKLLMDEENSLMLKNIICFIENFKMNIKNVKVIIPETYSELICEVKN